MHIANRMSRLGTETAFEVLVKAKALEAQGRDIVHLEIGEPDFDTPKNIITAAQDAIGGGYTHYGPSAGLPEAREAIAQYVARTRDISVSPDEVVITPGAKPIMFFGMMATIDEGDEVIYPNPGFPIYESVINFLGARPVALPLQEDKDFRFDIADLESRISDKTRMIIINSPQNPTGGILTDDDLRSIAELCIRHDLILFSDEIYSRITYDGFEHTSIARYDGMKERTIILDGFSKTYAMTGWRLGYGVMPASLASLVAKLQTNSTSCTAAFSQIAGVEALTGPQDEAEAMIDQFRKRRDVIVDGLNSIPGFRCHKPQGAFYVFPNIEGTGRSSQFMADYLLNEAGVACLSGTSFGVHGEGFIRFSYANSIDNIEMALERIKEAVGNLNPVEAGT
jgi:aspartate/methionine/tyrosine aminotransferase